MITAGAFALAAGIGALARAEAGRRWNRAGSIPWGTLVVNVAGSFCLGLLHETAPPMFTVIGVGGLGAFTTFSSFARDTVALAEARKWAHSAFYVIASCALSIAAAAVGMAAVG